MRSSLLFIDPGNVDLRKPCFVVHICEEKMAVKYYSALTNSSVLCSERRSSCKLVALFEKLLYISGILL